MKCNITHLDYNCEAYFKISKINLLVEKKWKEILQNINSFFFFKSWW